MNAPPPENICTGNFFYRRKCDNAWMVGWPGGGVNGAYQGGGAHTWIVHDEATGKDYSIGDQGSGNPNAYQRPPDEAPFALQTWKNFYELEPPDCPGGYETVCAKTPPPGIQSLPAVPLAQVTDPSKKASWIATFNCGGPVLPTFCPKDYVSRQQIAVMIWKAVASMIANPPGAGVPPATGTVFSDVPADSPFAPYIEDLARRGVLAGKSPCAAP